MDQLIAADLVLESAPGERREGRYRFKHAVVQEVAYNTLLVRRRAEMHRRVAIAYETVSVPPPSYSSGIVIPISPSPAASGRASCSPRPSTAQPTSR